MLKQSNKLKTNQKGFTIIEVLIVLAIAGLIMLVVFLAVPALNRSSHNQQYKTEGNNLLTAYNETVNNNGGTALTASVGTAATSPANDASTLLKTANVKSITKVTITATVGAVTPAAGEAVLELAAVCPSQASGTPTATGATPRSVALVYGIEGSSPYQCISQ